MVARAKNFEAVAVRVSDGAERVYGAYTTRRAALNAAAFPAAFGPAGVVWRVRDVRTGRFVAELSRG